MMPRQRRTRIRINITRRKKLHNKILGDTTRKSIGLIFLGGLILAIGFAIFLSLEGGLGKSFGIFLLIFGGGVGLWGLIINQQDHTKKNLRYRHFNQCAS